MLKLFLWLRYLRKKKIVFLSIAAVALSTALLIVVASLFTGFISSFEAKATKTIGDVILSSPVKFAKYPQLIEQLEQMSAVKAATANLSSQGLLHLGSGNVRAVQVWGIEPASRSRVTEFKQFLRKQGTSDKEPSFEVADSPEMTGGFLGIAVLAEPNEKTDEYDYSTIDRMLGESIVLTTGAMIETKTQTEDSDTDGIQSLGSSQSKFKRKTIKFTIADVVETGVYDLDKSFIYLPIQKLQEALYPNEEGQFANQIQIKLADDVPTDFALAQIRGLWKAFASEQLGWSSDIIEFTDIETAKQMQNKYVAEILKQMKVLLVIFGIVSLSVIVLVFCIFYMIVMTQHRDI